jgi:hypothetical protein
MNYTVDSFLEKLSSISPSTKKRNFESKKLIQRVYCNFKGNFGKYQILPFPSVITNFPFVVLENTREINIPRKNIAADGTVSQYNAWIKILPVSAYNIKDPSSGRVVNSLTSEEEALLKNVYSIWEELYKEVDGKNNTIDPVISKLIRRKNYTIFHGYCVNMFEEGDPRKAARQNFSGLFIMTAKNFVDIVNTNIVDNNIMNGTNNPGWLNDIYSSDLTGRKGFMMMSVSQNVGGPGFNISVNHVLNESFLQGVAIPEEEANEMQNPVETFLGWQARSDEEVPTAERRLFNAKLMQEAINFMTDLLARIRMGKQNNTSIKEAVDATTSLLLKEQEPSDSRGNAFQDPLLADMAKQAGEQTQPAAAGGYGFANVPNNPEFVQEKSFGADPFNSPAVSHQDPVTGSPVGAETPFSRPAFAGGNDSGFPFPSNK